jgi:3,4-dihydroxy 2-butanone 4-phosphate synthase/GTP cyclohydrolase II
VIGRVLDDLRKAERADARNGRPFVTLAWAQSLDGSIALDKGKPYRLSGNESLALTHALRAAHDVIVVGIGTLLADDPSLTVRLWQGPSPSPVVLDSGLRTPVCARVLAAAGGRPVRIACTENARDELKVQLEEKGAEVLRLPAWSNGWVDLDRLLLALGTAGIKRVMVEGGGKVLTSFLRASLVDYAVVTVAPTLLGGMSALGSLERTRLPRLDTSSMHRLADDWIMAGPLRWGEA